MNASYVVIGMAISVSVLTGAHIIFSDTFSDSDEALFSEQDSCTSTSIIYPHGCVIYNEFIDICRLPAPPLCQWVETTNEQECMELYEEYKSIISDDGAVSYDAYKRIRCWEGHNFFYGPDPDKNYDWFDSDEERCTARYNYSEASIINPDVYMIPYEDYRLEICNAGSDSGQGR